MIILIIWTHFRGEKPKITHFCFHSNHPRTQFPQHFVIMFLLETLTFVWRTKL